MVGSAVLRGLDLFHQALSRRYAINRVYDRSGLADAVLHILENDRISLYGDLYGLGILVHLDDGDVHAGHALQDAEVLGELHYAGMMRLQDIKDYSFYV